jgi:hypothetical protein
MKHLVTLVTAILFTLLVARSASAVGVHNPASPSISLSGPLCHRVICPIQINSLTNPLVR